MARDPTDKAPGSSAHLARQTRESCSNMLGPTHVFAVEIAKN
jgi:hypothetical protein